MITERRRTTTGRLPALKLRVAEFARIRVVWRGGIFRGSTRNLAVSATPRIVQLQRLLAVWVVLGWAGVAAGQAPPSMTVRDYIHQRGDYELTNTAYNQFPATLDSPHIRWAGSPAWGEPRVLIVLPTWAAREAVELKQRFPCQVAVVMTRSHLEWAAPKQGEPYGEVDAKEPTRIALTLLNRPDKYDAIVIGKLDWAAIPELVRQLILDRFAASCSSTTATIPESKDMLKIIALSVLSCATGGASSSS